MCNILNLYKTALQSLGQENKQLLHLLSTINQQVIPYTFSHLKSEDEMMQQVKSQMNHYQSFENDLVQYSQENKIALESVFDSYWNYVLPYFNHLLSIKYQNGAQSIFAGVLGVQGAGKTTFSGLIQKIGDKDGKRVMVLSIDDFYLSFEDRQKLRQLDARFMYRGPPGTHDINRLYEVFHQIKAKQLPINIPIFDKSLHNGQGDLSGFKTYTELPDIVIFEGWFIGLRESKLDKISPIKTNEDLEFAQVCLEKLREYYKLWDMIDSFLIIMPEEYNYSRQWRKDAEHKMIAKTGKGMTDQELDLFVDYFWKALHPEIYINNYLQQKKFDLVVKLSLQHSINQIIES